MSLFASVNRNSLLLGAFALITAVALAITRESTADRIAAEERKAARKALLEIVPKDRHSNDLLTDTTPIEPPAWWQLGLKNGGEIYIARNDGEIVAVIIPSVAPDGYSGEIRLLVGINRDASIAGVRVLAHNETPGLGDKIDIRKSDWINSFAGSSLENPPRNKWAVKKDGGNFDQFTGATITPRAVVKQIKKTLEFFDQSEILKKIHAPENTLKSAGQGDQLIGNNTEER